MIMGVICGQLARRFCAVYPHLRMIIHRRAVVIHNLEGM